MEVLVVDPSNYTSLYDYSLCKGLSNTGCDVELVTSISLYTDRALGSDFPINYLFFKRSCQLLTRFPFLLRIPLLRKVVKAMEYPMNLFSFVDYIQRRKAKIIHFQWVIMPLIDFVLLRWLRNKRLKLVYTAHDVLPHNQRWYHKYVYGLVYKIVDAIIVHSNNVRTELVNIFNIVPSTVKVIPHGSFDNYFSDLRNIRRIPKRKAKEVIGLKPYHKVVFFCGPVEPYKGLVYLINAFPVVKNNIPNAKLVIAGRAKGSFAYAELMRELNINEDVLLDLRDMSDQEMVNYYLASDVVVLPYVKTYQSAVLLSAYTLGRPVVVTDTGGLGEVVEDGRSGYVVPPEDEQALATAICKLLGDGANIESMGRYAAKLAKTKYSWDSIARKTELVYSELHKDYRRGCQD